MIFIVSCCGVTLYLRQVSLKICLTTVYKTARQNKKNHDCIAIEGARLSFEISLILEST